MGKCKNAIRGREDAQKGNSPTHLSHRGEAGDMGNAVHNLRDDMASLEEGLLQMGAPSKMPFRFLQSSQSPWEWSVMPEYQQDHPTQKDLMHYCIHIRVTLGRGLGNQPPPSHIWSGLLIVDMFEEGIEEQITKAIVLAPGEAFLFFGRWSLKEGLPLGNARDVGFSLMGPINWTGRTAHVEATINTVQEGFQTTADAVVKKRTKARGPGCLHGKTKVIRFLVKTYDIGEWCGSWKKMLLKWRQEMAMRLIAGLSREMHDLSVLVKVIGGTEDKEDHGFLETCLVVHPLLGWEFWL